MGKNNNLKDYLTDLYEGIVSKKADASRNPQNFRAEIEAIQTNKPIKVSTEAEMTALLDTAEVGAVYFFIGESDTYKKGYYEVREWEMGGKYFKYLPLTAGTLEITENGEYDVNDKEKVVVAVEGSTGGGSSVEGTAIPVGGAPEKIYFNLNNSVKQTNDYLSQLTYIQTDLFEYPIYGICGYSINEYPIIMFARKEEVLGSLNVPIVTYGIWCLTTSGNLIELYNTEEWGGENKGFKTIDFDPIQINSYGLVYCWYDDKSTPLTEFMGLPLGLENEKIKNVLSITPFGASEDSPLPPEISTEEEMNALEVGTVFRYVGETTEAFENGVLYEVCEEVSGFTVSLFNNSAYTFNYGIDEEVAENSMEYGTITLEGVNEYVYLTTTEDGFEVNSATDCTYTIDGKTMKVYPTSNSAHIEFYLID